MNSTHKYKIEEMLLKLPKAQYNMALNCLPLQLGISANTLRLYRRLQLTDATDIPHIHVARMEKFFGLKPGELANYPIDMRTLAEQINRPICEPDNYGLLK